MSIEINRNDKKSTPKVTSNSLYDESLYCKNKCGFFGNQMQYEGYCSNCYAKLKRTQKFNNSAMSMSSSISFDEGSSLLNNINLNTQTNAAASNQIWNEHSNLNKFSSKKDTKRTFKLFRRSSALTSATSSSNASNSTHSSNSTSSSLNLVETVTKVADKAVNLVDQSLTNLNNSTVSLSSFISNNGFTSSSSDSNLIELSNCAHRLVTFSPSSTNTNNSSNTNLVSLFNEQSTSQKFDPMQLLNEFEEHFKQTFPQCYQDLNKLMKQFLDQFIELTKRINPNEPGASLEFSSNKQFEMVQDFFKKIYKYIQTSASIRTYLEKLNTITNHDSSTNLSLLNTSLNDSNLSQQQQSTSMNVDDADRLYEAIMIMVESYICNNVYDSVFPLIMSEFEENDMKLQRRIRNFYWITNEMIGTCIDESSIFFRESYEEALNYIVEMDSKRTAYEKMICITECSKNIYKAINISSDVSRHINNASSSQLTTPTNEELPMNGFSTTSQPSSKSNSGKKPTNNVKSLATADDYLPAFIYIVLKANPTMVYSNINFISRYAFEKRVLQGEHAYHFCSLNAVIQHIENLNHKHLNMTEEEFEMYSNGLIDESNAIKILNSNLKLLSELTNKKKLLEQEAMRLKKSMNAYKQSVQVKFHTCLLNNKPMYTENIEGFNRHVLDDNEDVLLFNQAKLISPLKPIVNSSTLHEKITQSEETTLNVTQSSNATQPKTNEIPTEKESLVSSTLTTITETETSEIENK